MQIGASRWQHQPTLHDVLGICANEPLVGLGDADGPQSASPVFSGTKGERDGSAGDSRRLQGLPAGRHDLNGLTHKSILLVFVSFNIYLKSRIHCGAPFQAECKHTIEYKG